jgi:hypothetical protein
MGAVQLTTDAAVRLFTTSLGLLFSWGGITRGPDPHQLATHTTAELPGPVVQGLTLMRDA